jgi:hypothetical protein
MKNATINLYQFNELSNEAKEKAISQHEDFLLSIGQECENEQGEMETLYSDTIERSEVIESIEMNEYYFFIDGELAHCTTYTGGEKTGTTEFIFKGTTQTI